jgi:Fe-coproporphyrin III synthase
MGAPRGPRPFGPPEGMSMAPAMTATRTRAIARRGLRLVRHTGMALDQMRRPITEAGRIRRASIEATILCNLRCPMCWWWGTNGVAFKMVQEKHPYVKEALTDDEVRGVIDQLAPHGAQLYFSGGEPFSRKGVIALMEYASQKGLKFGFTTNGTLITDDLLARLVACENLDYVTLSIDGPEAVHDAIRGAGNYRRTMEFARKLVASRRAKDHPRVQVNSTFTREIAGHLGEIVDHAVDAGFDAVNFQNLWFTDAPTAAAHAEMLRQDFGIEDHGSEGHVFPTPGAAWGRAIVEEYHGVAARSPVPLTMSPDLTPEEGALYYSDLSFSKAKSCFRPWEGMIIKANGDVVFCPDQWISGWPIGNVRQQSIDDIWNGPRAGQFRAALDRRKLYPICPRCCIVNGESK